MDTTIAATGSAHNASDVSKRFTVKLDIAVRIGRIPACPLCEADELLAGERRQNVHQVTNERVLNRESLVEVPIDR